MKENRLKFWILTISIFICFLILLINLNITGKNIFDFKKSSLLKTESGSSLKSFIKENTTPKEFSIPSNSRLEKLKINEWFLNSSDLKVNIKKINGLSLTGEVEFYSPESLVRIIGIDEDKKEYLIYEIYPLLNIKSKFSVNNICEETCALNRVNLKNIHIQIKDSKLKIESINYLVDSLNENFVSNFDISRKKLLSSQENYKISSINQNQRSWVAGKTSVSELSYEDKKKLFKKVDGTIPEDLPNLKGLEYYKGGIFDLRTLKSINQDIENLVEESETDALPPGGNTPIFLFPPSWDWRNVHGENWNTPVKNQLNGATCWAHAKIATMESNINLFYNNHYDVNLSEQMLLDSLGPAPPGCYSPCDLDFCRFQENGIADENCDIYDPSRNYNPTYICEDWQSRSWKQSNHYTLNKNPSQNCPKKITTINLKKSLINDGPVFADLNTMLHSMLLEGYNGIGNWTSTELCEPVGIGNFCTNNGCSSLDCSQSQINQTQQVCNLIEYPNYSFSSFISNYKCENTPDGTKWIRQKNSITCPQNQVCGDDNQCHDITAITPGHELCGIFQYPLEFAFTHRLKYTPQQGETRWVFKNSWGSEWGENGYLIAIASVHDLQYSAVLNGIVTPPINNSYWPQGFNNQIRCVDNDGDMYCNWGISKTKPTTCPSFCKPKKDCDDSNPTKIDFISDYNLNCREINFIPNQNKSVQ